MKRDIAGQRNATPRGNRPYDVSHSFVRKVASRVSGLFGGIFSTPDKEDSESVESRLSQSEDELPDSSQPCSNNTVNPIASPAQYEAFRNHLSINRASEPVAGPSGLQQRSLARNDNATSRILDPSNAILTPGPSGIKSRLADAVDRTHLRTDDNIRPGPSGLGSKHSYGRDDVPVTRSSKFARYEPIERKTSAGDDHSESSESTSGCSSLVPQADRFSQSTEQFATPRRKSLTLDEKLNYARQLKQSRSSLYLNRSIPIHAESPRPSGTPSFDISVYGKPILNKSVRETMLNSPFYTGQTTFGGAAARRSGFTVQPSPRNIRSQIAVKPANEEREGGADMSQTARRILAALEELSTPINDAKRIPAPTPPLASKRRMVDTNSSSSAPKRPALEVPTVADLLKLRRLEEIQESTDMARQVTVAKREPSPPRWSGKIMTKRKDRGKTVDDPPPPPPDLPKVPLKFTSLPKFELPTAAKSNPAPPPAVPAPTPVVAPAPVPPAPAAAKPQVESFKFSTPSVLSLDLRKKSSNSSTEFTLSPPTPLSEWKKLEPLSTVMTPDAMAKLKRKSVEIKPDVATPAKTLSTGSVMDVLGKTKSSESNGPKSSSPVGFGDKFKPAAGSWSCSSCMLNNASTADKCIACETPKAGKQPAPPPPKISSSKDNNPPVDNKSFSGFGDKFKPASGSWSCSSCMLNNGANLNKCIACETPKPGSETVAKKSDGFGDKFKPAAGSWSCNECMLSNTAAVTQCVACETPKPGSVANKAKPIGSWKCSLCLKTNKDVSKCAACDSPQPNGPLSTTETKPGFSFGLPPASCTFKFGVDKADSVDSVSNGPKKEAPLFDVKTSTGTFSFGIPPAQETTTKTPSASVGDKKDTIVPIVPPEVTKIAPSVAVPVAEVTKPSIPFSFGIVAPITTTPVTNETNILSSKPSFTATPIQPFSMNGPAATSSAPTEIKSFSIPVTSTLASPAFKFSTENSATQPIETKPANTPFFFSPSENKPAPSNVFKFGEKTGQDANSSGVFRFGAPTNLLSQPQPSLAKSNETATMTAPSFGLPAATSSLFPIAENVSSSTQNVTSAPASMFSFGKPATSTPFGSTSSTESMPFTFRAPSVPAAAAAAQPPPFNPPASVFGAPTPALNSMFPASQTPAFGSATATGFAAPPASVSPAFGTGPSNPFDALRTLGLPASTLTPFAAPNMAATPNFATPAQPPSFGQNSAPSAFPAASPFQFNPDNIAAPPGVPPTFQFNIGQAPPSEPRRHMIRAKRRSHQK